MLLPLELRELRLALAILLLARELGGELLEAPRSDAPERLQLEIGQALVPFPGPPEIFLERGELLLDAHRRAFLQLQPVEQAMPLVVERVQFLLELRPVAEQLEQPLVFDGGFATAESIRQPPQAFRQVACTLEPAAAVNEWPRSMQ